MNLQCNKQKRMKEERVQILLRSLYNPDEKMKRMAKRRDAGRRRGREKKRMGHKGEREKKAHMALRW